MNYADIKKIDVANGEGVRVSVFVSGCNHHCKGCFNECAWDFNYGKEFSEKEEQQIIDYMNHDYISGLSLLGGEPLEPKNQEGLLPLVKKVKEKIPPAQKTINKYCFASFNFFSSNSKSAKAKIIPNTNGKDCPIILLFICHHISYMTERIINITIIFLLSLKIFAHI